MSVERFDVRDGLTFHRDHMTTYHFETDVLKAAWVWRTVFDRDDMYAAMAYCHELLYLKTR